MTDVQALETESVEPVIQVGSETSDTAADTEEKVVFDDQQQKVVNDIVGDKTKKFHEERRAKEDALKSLAELQAKQPKEVRPNIPDLPDPVMTEDDAFKEAVSVRDKAIEQAATFDAREKVMQEQAETAAADEQQKAFKHFQTVTGAYNERVKTSGIPQDQMTEAAATLSTAGISPSLAMHLLEDDQGPQLAVYLASDMAEVENMSQMSPTKQGAYLEAVIKPKAVAASQGTGAPNPASRLNGGGRRPSELGPPGTIYE